MYHGTPTERAVLRRTVMRLPREVPFDKTRGRAVPSKAQSTKETKSHGGGDTKSRLNPREPRSRPRSTKSGHLSKDETSDDQSEPDNLTRTDEFTPDPGELDVASFPVVITTYEIIIKDRVHLSAYNFSYIGDALILLKLKLTYRPL
jgi:ATP-dependent DNA helicase